MLSLLPKQPRLDKEHYSLFKLFNVDPVEEKFRAMYPNHNYIWKPGENIPDLPLKYRIVKSEFGKVKVCDSGYFGMYYKYQEARFMMDFLSKQSKELYCIVRLSVPAKDILFVSHFGRLGVSRLFLPQDIYEKLIHGKS